MKGLVAPLLSSLGDLNGSSNRRKNLSASEWARREEEKRRRQRAGDVVIGKTSAIPDAKDYVIDPKSTEQEWMRQASNIEQAVFRYTEKGMESLKMLQLDDAIDSFNRVFALRPEAYLWQAGIAKFYQNDLEGAAEIFAQSASRYESKFGEPASEERIWRHACGLKLLKSMSRSDRRMVEENGGVETLLPEIPEKENTAELLRSEMRKVIRTSRELFSASARNDCSQWILCRARLRSLGGKFDSKPQIDRKMWRLNSWFYLGLHYDVLGNFEESKRCMKMALRLCPSSGNGDDIIHTLPVLHMTTRNWFDDDAFEPYENESLLISVDQTLIDLDEVPAGIQDADPILVGSIKTSVEELRYVDLQDTLKARGLLNRGSKEELQKRLFLSLMRDIGFQP